MTIWGGYLIFQSAFLGTMCLNGTTHSPDRHFVLVYLNNFLFIVNNK
jgi:hypothetical protein